MAVQGKKIQMLFDSTVDTYEHQMQMLSLTTLFKPGDADMQNSGDVVWRQVQQHAPIIQGWDLTGLETEIIQETYPAVLNLPTNDIFKQRADAVRDLSFWEKRGKQSGLRQATELNKGIANAIIDSGSLFYSTNATSGFDAIAEGEAILDERQTEIDTRYVMLNSRDYFKYAKDLAARQTLQGRPADTWATGMIGSNIAGFDVYRGNFIKTLAGGADPATTTTAAVSDKPEAGSVNAAKTVVTNIDFRISSSIPVVASASYNVGDYVQFGNGGTPVESVGLADKTPTGQPMTFKIVAKPTGTSIQVYPKPIAADDPGLSTLEKAYANIDTQIGNGATVNRLNTAALSTPNLFWCKDSIEVTGGDAPLQLLSEFGGMKVISTAMSNGQTMYMAYDGNIDTLEFKCRLFTWWTATNKNPSANGVWVSV